MILIDPKVESYTFRECFTVGFPYNRDNILDPRSYSRMRVNGFPIKSAYSLFLAICFSEYKEMQESILEETNLKYLGEYLDPNKIREDYEEIKIDLMYWCLKIKMLCHRKKFGIELEKSRHSIVERLISETRPLVYISTKDSFFGAKVDTYSSRSYYYDHDYQRLLDNCPMKGVNAIGKLLARLRDEPEFYSVEPLDIPNFTLYDTVITTQSRKKTYVKNRLEESDSKNP